MGKCIVSLRLGLMLFWPGVEPAIAGPKRAWQMLGQNAGQMRLARALQALVVHCTFGGKW
jgi:hypothetical protein